MTIDLQHDRPRSGYESACSAREAGPAIRDVLNRVGDKWSMLIVATLKDGTLRFSELQQHIPGISQRMLTLTLRHLERDGLVERTVHAQVPPRVDYALTVLGQTLLGPALALADWAVETYPSIERSREEYDARS